MLKSIYYKAKTVPFKLFFKSLLNKEGTEELERVYNSNKLENFQHRLSKLDEELDWQIYTEQEELKALIEREQQRTALRIQQHKANKDILERTLNYEITCLRIKLKRDNVGNMFNSNLEGV